MPIKRLIASGFFLMSGISYANDSGAGALVQIAGLPFALCTFSTVCPLAWPFGIVTSGASTMTGGAASSSTSSGLSTSGTTTTATYINHGDFPGTEKNVYEELDDWQDDYGKSSVRGRLIGAIKWFFPSKELVENWDYYREQQKEKKKQKKQERAQAKSLNKKTEQMAEIVCVPELTVKLEQETDQQKMLTPCFLLEKEPADDFLKTTSDMSDTSSSSTSD